MRIDVTVPADLARNLNVLVRVETNAKLKNGASGCTCAQKRGPKQPLKPFPLRKCTDNDAAAARSGTDTGCLMPVRAAREMSACRQNV